MFSSAKKVRVREKTSRKKEAERVGQSNGLKRGIPFPIPLPVNSTIPAREKKAATDIKKNIKIEKFFFLINKFVARLTKKKIFTDFKNSKKEPNL